MNLMYAINALVQLAKNRIDRQHPGHSSSYHQQPISYSNGIEQQYSD